MSFNTNNDLLADAGHLLWLSREYDDAWQVLTCVNEINNKSKDYYWHWQTHQLNRNWNDDEDVDDNDNDDDIVDNEDDDAVDGE